MGLERVSFAPPPPHSGPWGQIRSWFFPSHSWQPLASTLLCLLLQCIRVRTYETVPRWATQYLINGAVPAPHSWDPICPQCGPPRPKGSSSCFQVASFLGTCVDGRQLAKGSQGVWATGKVGKGHTMGDNRDRSPRVLTSARLSAISQDPTCQRQKPSCLRHGEARVRRWLAGDTGDARVVFPGCR